MTIQDFRPVGEVIADDRRRIPFGKAGVRDGDKFALAVNSDGQILLTPLATIPARELIIWENEQLRASLMLGIAQVRASDTADLNLDDLDLPDDAVDDDEE